MAPATRVKRKRRGSEAGWVGGDAALGLVVPIRGGLCEFFACPLNFGRFFAPKARGRRGFNLYDVDGELSEHPPGKAQGH